MTTAGNSALSSSQSMLEDILGLSDAKSLNGALTMFSEHSQGGNRLTRDELSGLLDKMPELYFGLEGMLGTRRQVVALTADLVIMLYGQPEHDCIEWDGFHRMWREVYDNSTGRLTFFHRIIVHKYDADRQQALSARQVEALIDDLYYSTNSVFAGDKRVPERSMMMSALWKQLADGPDSRVTAEDLKPILCGDFCAC
ncbi:hypothetical protein DIPPA_07347 [Diplonema papillatum]|nr:hypothetical protein DIPPA_07347 [Diplonema papillatum]